MKKWSNTGIHLRYFVQMLKRRKKYRHTALFLLITATITFTFFDGESFQHFVGGVLGRQPHCPRTQTLSKKNHFPLQYIISPNHICPGHKLFQLMIIVCSAVKNVLERQTIRETWGSPTFVDREAVRLAFLLGDTVDGEDARLVREESRTHNDIIQMDFIDTYENLTYKSVSLLKWVSQHCPNALYVLKTDDDMFINVPNLVRMVSEVTEQNVMFGYLFYGVQPIRDEKNKWYVPESQYQGEVFPDYLSGTCYLLSGDIVPKLYEESKRHPYLLLEDVFVTGVCACGAGVKRVHRSDFWYRKLQSTGCAFRGYISGHRVGHYELRKIWGELGAGTRFCWFS